MAFARMHYKIMIRLMDTVTLCVFTGTHYGHLKENMISLNLMEQNDLHAALLFCFQHLPAPLFSFSLTRRKGLVPLTYGAYRSFTA